MIARGRTQKSLTTGAAALLALLLALPAVPAEGKELLREGFETPAAGVSARGRHDGSGCTRTEREFRVEGAEVERLPISVTSASKGSISFDLQRRDDAPAEYRGTIFTLAGDATRGDGREADEIFFLQVRWESEFDPTRPVLKFRGSIYHEYGLGLWPPEVLLDRAVEPGQWIHVDLVWDDGAGRYDLFVDGRLQEKEPLFYDAKMLTREPDRRRLANKEALRVGLKPYFKSWPFSRLLAKVDEVHFGTHTSRSEPAAVYTPLSNAVLDNFAMHVNEIPEPGYVPPPALSIAALDHDAAMVAGFSGKLVSGDTVTVTTEGTPGGSASFDVARVAEVMGEISVSWKGWGVYLEDITFFEDDQVDLRDVEEYRVYVSGSPIGDITPETTFVETLEVEEQSIVVNEVSVSAEDGQSSNLELLEAGTPYYVAVMALMDDGSLLPVIEPVQGIAMSEVEGAPGTYEGTYTVGYRDRYPEAVVVGRLGSGDAQVAMVSDETIEVDPALNIQVISSVEELKADEESTAEIKVTVTDANDDPVSDHEVRFVLATTSQYTGVVGGGNFTDEVGGSLSRDFWGETNLFGQATATYTAGFAAKTAIIVARDMQSSDVGVGYVKTYIEANAELELEAVQEVAGKALGYTISVTSSDEWLTADGESEARITALVAQNGIPVEGHRVSFRVTAGAGKIRTVDNETGSDGKARAVYTAGKKIGIVLITAVDQTVGISGSVQIELRSDAPAKIAIVLTPELLPADGRSTADIEVVVTDINDNPNEGVEVEYEVEIGSGRLRNIDEVTDRRGESTAEYVAGRMPGKVSVKVTVRSTVPTEEEMAAARALATAVTDYDFY